MEVADTSAEASSTLSNASSPSPGVWTYGGDKDDTALLPFLSKDTYIKVNTTTICLSILYSLTFLVGLVGNIFVILVFTGSKRIRSFTNLFLVNLAVADMSVLLVCMPVTLGTYLYQDWVYGEFMCKLTPFLQTTAVCVSVLSLLVISLNRYYGIHRPIKAKIIFSKTKVLVTLLVVWMVSSLTCSPLLFVNRIESYGIPGLVLTRVCSEDWQAGLTGKQLFNVFVFLVMFVIPVLLMTFAYTRIATHLWSGDVLLRRAGSDHLQQHTRMLRQRRQTVKMLIALVVLFTVSWLPYHAVNLWLDYNMVSVSVTVVAEKVYPFVQWFGFTNSAMNPLCYGFLSVQFRKALVSILCSSRAHTSNRSVVTSHRFSASSDATVPGTLNTHLPSRQSM